MSYILDALKKAESERERGLVPSLRAQPMSGSQALVASQQSFKPVFVVAAIGLLAVLVMLGFWWRAQATEPSPPASAVVAMGAPVSTTPLSPSIPIVAVNSVTIAGLQPAASSKAAVPAATTQTAQPELPAAPRQGSAIAPAQITPLPAQPAVALAIAVPPAPKSSDKPVTPVRPDKATPKPAQSDLTPVAVPAKPAPQAVDNPLKNPGETRVSPMTTAQNQLPVSKLSELPADVRLALPKLVISGSTYSDTPAYRMVIINGQVFHEGEKIAADTVLQQIKPNIMVLDYKGQRYSMPY